MAYEKLKFILINSYAVQEHNINTEANIYTDLGLDSLDILEIVMEVEEAFAIHITDEEVDSITTVDDFVKLIESKR